MRRAAVFVLWVGLAVSSVGGAALSATSRFDGRWSVTLACQGTTDNALPYTFRFSAEVKNGALHGEHGVSGQPGWLVMDGDIDSGGDVALLADGLTGGPEYNLGHVSQGQAYTYRIKAHFDAAHGTGTRTSGARVCTLDFVRA